MSAARSNGPGARQAVALGARARAERAVPRALFAALLMGAALSSSETAAPVVRWQHDTAFASTLDRLLMWRSNERGRASSRRAKCKNCGARTPRCLQNTRAPASGRVQVRRDHGTQRPLQIAVGRSGVDSDRAREGDARKRTKQKKTERPPSALAATTRLGSSRAVVCAIETCPMMRRSSAAVAAH